MAKIKRICRICKKEFYVIPSRIEKGGGKFCSKKCYGLFQRKRLKRKCKMCGKEFWVTPSRIKNGDVNHCSQKCYRLSRQRELTCQQCGKVFVAYIYRNRKFCSHSCAGKSIRGKNNSNWQGGKIERKCQQCGKVFWTKQNGAKDGYGRFCSRVCYGKGQRRERKGSNNPNWKGGIALMQNQIRNCPKYNQWRADVFERDNWTCLVCGKTGKSIEAHHIKPFALIIQENNIQTFEQAMECEELWNVDNGVTLCVEDHNLTHKNTPLKMAGIGL